MSVTEIRTGSAPELEAFLVERIYEHNAAATGYNDAESFSASRQDDAGRIEAGISGFTWGGCCFVSNLWVSEELRGRGVGSELLAAAEAHARVRRCRVVVLSSHTFQAPNFYASRGYEQVARIEDYPAGHADIVFVKHLASSVRAALPLSSPEE